MIPRRMGNLRRCVEPLVRTSNQQENNEGPKVVRMCQEVGDKSAFRKRSDSDGSGRIGAQRSMKEAEVKAET